MSTPAPYKKINVAFNDSHLRINFNARNDLNTIIAVLAL